MEELLNRVAEIKGMPASLVERSAQARAEKTGATLQAVLTEWAGGEAPTLDTSSIKTTEPKESSATSDETTSSETTSSETTSSETTSDEHGDEHSESASKNVDHIQVTAPVEMTTDDLVELAAEAREISPKLILSSATSRAERSGLPLDEVLAEWAGVDISSIQSGENTVSPSEPQESDGIGSAARNGYPRWLATAFVLIPLLAITYILVAPNGPDCGTAGQLLVDPVTGQALGCDGSQYGVTETNYMSIGAGIYDQCVACHSADGSGGVGPAFSGGAVLATFPSGSCNQQIEWVKLGTAGWPDPTYGANNKPVGGFGIMPPFGGSLSNEELAAVSLYERVEFAGQPLEEAEIDCGLVTPQDSE